MTFSPDISIWLAALSIGTITAIVGAVANIVQTHIAGKQARARQLDYWERQDLIEARRSHYEKVATTERQALLRQGAETRGLVNHRLTVALQAQLLALQGTLTVLSERYDPSEAVRRRIGELQTEISNLQAELAERASQQAAIDLEFTKRAYEKS